MGRPGQRHLRDGALEDNSVARECVQGRGLYVSCSVAADVIGADGVDRNQNHVRPRTACGNWRRFDTREQHCHDRQELENILQ